MGARDMVAPGRTLSIKPSSFSSSLLLRMYVRACVCVPHSPGTLSRKAHSHVCWVAFITRPGMEIVRCAVGEYHSLQLICLLHSIPLRVFVVQPPLRKPPCENPRPTSTGGRRPPVRPLAAPPLVAPTDPCGE